MAPDLDAMLARRRCGADHRRQRAVSINDRPESTIEQSAMAIQKIDLGEHGRR